MPLPAGRVSMCGVLAMRPTNIPRHTTTDLAGARRRPVAGTGPIQPQIVNDPDDFFYQVPRVADYRGSGIYWWRNNGSYANVHQATTVTTGRIALVIRDANGAEVYSRSLADNGIFVSSGGAAGRWSIHIMYEGASGSVSFRAQKKT